MFIIITLNDISTHATYFKFNSSNLKVFFFKKKSKTRQTKSVRAMKYTALLSEIIIYILIYDLRRFLSL